MFKLLSIGGLALVCIFSICALAQTNDPTRPLGRSIAGEARGGNADSGFHLSSIIIGEDRKIAIINNQTLHENQTLKGSNVTVKRIENEAVTLQQGNKTWRIPINKTAVRK